MLKIIIPSTEFYNEETSEFIIIKTQELLLEHSLVSISKWESKWEKPFLDKTQKTSEETLDYIKCMTITQNVKPEVYLALSQDNVSDIMTYIQSSRSATTFGKDKNSSASREIITSELIYYWMINYNIPVEFEKWHLNRLLNLIRICSIKSQPPKKMSKSQIMSRNKSLNDARRAKLHTKG